MCVSASVSFGMSGLLMTGGLYAAHKASIIDKRYLPLALFPFCVGLQQLAEGLVWIAWDLHANNLLRAASLSYLFFVWIFWPVWVPYMTLVLEENDKIKKILYAFIVSGLLLGMILYLPNFWNASWLHTEIVKHSVAYRCTLAADLIFPRSLTYLMYLACIGIPPLFSSHRALNLIGATLICSANLTYFFFSYAEISVLCFFAAAVTVYILYVILGNKCALIKM